MRRLVLIPRKKRYIYVSGRRPIGVRSAGVQTVKDHSGSLEGPEPGKQPDHEAPPQSRRQLDSKYGITSDKTQTPDPLAEFDEYGTELHKDARVWKVYVEEADKHDTELVNGWNESTDVILIFAALFSAISTAFLIESSKLLQPDPAEQSAQSLAIISQTLSAIANGTRSPGSVPSPSSDPVEFTPSRAAICVNVLWYLSLGLSLATSFIAILAKDWCHSFMSGRTGHPYSQMCRRQRKWDMIEKWKMSELLTILPSLIHVALLLFSVGLCIYLSDTYIAVAIPIFCATGAAIGFYIWSSMAAISIDYFPYPTIISQVCRARSAHYALQAALSLGSRFGSHPVIRNLYQIVLALSLVPAWILIFSLFVFGIFCFAVKQLKGPLNRCDRYLARSSPLLQLVAVPLSKFARFFFWYPADVTLDCISQLLDYSMPIAKSIWSQLLGATWGPEWRAWVPNPVAQASADEPNQGDVTSLALSWLITNCEVPQSVDIALQSIAGATSRTSRKPLLDCHATLEILRRLASSNLYKGPDSRTDTIISLYSRALTRLGGATGPAPATEQHRDETELEGLIWDVHLESEKRVAASIVSGSFDPTPANLDSLRVGNTAASNALKLLGRDSQKTNIDLDQMLSLIANRLESHIRQNQPLHEAALVSLLTAAALLLPFAQVSPTVTSVASLCAKVIKPQLSNNEPSDPLLVKLAIVCVCASRQPMELETLGSLNTRSLLRDVVGGLPKCYAEEMASPRIRLMFGLEALLAHSEPFQPAIFDLDVREVMLNHVASSLHALYHTFLGRYQVEAAGNNSGDNLMELLRAMQSPLSLALIQPSRTFLPFLIIGPIQRLWWSTGYPADNEWAKLASDSRFPAPSRTLTRLIEQSDFISHLERMAEKDDATYQFIALGQLWLLFTVCLDTSSELPDERERLGVQLRKYHQSHPESEHIRQAQIGDQLVQMWESRRIDTNGTGIWPARLMECVYQSRNSPLPQDVHDDLRGYGVPDDHRGLPSFTSWRPQAIVTDAGDRPVLVNSTQAAANDENTSGNRVPVRELGGATVLDETDDRAVGGHTPPGGGQKITHKAIETENLAHDRPDGRNVIEGEDNPTTAEGQKVGDTGSRTDDPVAESGGAGNGADVEPHISIDVHASETVSR